MPRTTHEDYLAAWICPLEVEQIAATCMLDEQHERLPQPSTDPNSYTLGSIHGHNVVITGLPAANNNAAATVVAHLRSTFPKIQYGLLVGIGGGVPTKTDAGGIHLGHVVVSKPTGRHSGTIQYDQGKAREGKFERTGSVPPPPSILLNAAQTLAVTCSISQQDPLVRTMKEKIDTSSHGLRRFRYPGADKDNLYESSHSHKVANTSCEEAGCETDKIVKRENPSGVEKDDIFPSRVIVHRGNIATGGLVIKNALLRDSLAMVNKVLCFETEAAGALIDLPCLVVRGISDYCDSHKNDDWHGYAAAAAAAYARNLFTCLPLDKSTRLTSMSPEEEPYMGLNHERLFDSLQFSTVGAGRQNLDDAYEDTCQWIFQEISEAKLDTAWANFPKWLRENDSIYWIQGKAGAGKSTLMNYISGQPKTISLLKEWSQGEEVLTPIFFFWRSGAYLQKSTEGLLKSLLCQVIDGQSQFPLKKLWSALDGEPRTWGENKLRKMLLRAVDLSNRHICFFIDGLDELSGNWVDVIEPIYQISQKSHVKVCVSSRPENIFIESFRQSPNLRVNDFTYTDMEKFVYDKLSRFPFTVTHEVQTSTRFNKLVKDVCSKAEGVWQWTRYAVRCVVDGFINCDSFEELEVRLRELPKDLRELYANMLGRVQPRYQQMTRNVFRTLLLVPKADFDPVHLEMSLLDMTFIGLRSLVPKDADEYLPKEVRRLCETTRRQWNAACMGLIDAHSVYSLTKPDPNMTVFEQIFNDFGQTKVQFTHETVRSFAIDYLQSFYPKGKSFEQDEADHNVEIHKVFICGILWQTKQTTWFKDVSWGKKLERRIMDMWMFIEHYYASGVENVDEELDSIFKCLDRVYRDLVREGSTFITFEFESECDYKLDWMGYLVGNLEGNDITSDLGLSFDSESSCGAYNYIIDRFDDYEGCPVRPHLGKATYLMASLLGDRSIPQRGPRLFLFQFLLDQGAEVNRSVFEGPNPLYRTFWAKLLFSATSTLWRSEVAQTEKNEALTFLIRNVKQFATYGADLSEMVFCYRPIMTIETNDPDSDYEWIQALFLVSLKAVRHSFQRDWDHLDLPVLDSILEKDGSGHKADFMGFLQLPQKVQLPSAHNIEDIDKYINPMFHEVWKEEWTRQLFDSPTAETVARIELQCANDLRAAGISPLPYDCPTPTC